MGSALIRHRAFLAQSNVQQTPTLASLLQQHWRPPCALRCTMTASIVDLTADALDAVLANLDWCDLACIMRASRQLAQLAADGWLS